MMSAGWWKACYAAEAPFPIAFAGTRPFDADSDGDGVRDGADDQDFDDVPNIMELYRSLAGNVAPQGGCNDPDAPEIDPATVPAETWVNPFNPCLPDPWSRTCPRHPAMTDAYPPFGPELEAPRLALGSTSRARAMRALGRSRRSRRRARA